VAEALDIKDVVARKETSPRTRSGQSADAVHEARPPVIPCQNCAVDFEPVKQADDIARQRRLLAAPRSIRRQEAGWAKAAKMRNDDAGARRSLCFGVELSIGSQNSTPKHT
jgi:hypothetical protein